MKFNETFNKVIAECNGGKSVAFTDNMVRKNLVEDYKNFKPSLEKMELSALKRTLLSESVFRNPTLLIDDIMSKIESGIYEFTYTKDELAELMLGFNYLEKFKKEVPSKFKLTIMCLSREEFFKRFGIQLIEDAVAEEVLDPNDEWHEIVNLTLGKTRHRYSVIKVFLEEELRHVWTYVLGMADESFYEGRTAFKAKDRLDIKKFSSYQKQVLSSMYFGDISALQKDYDYIFKIQEGNAENWELSVHVDAIIDLLVDYYDGSTSTRSYINNILEDVKKNTLSPNDKMLKDFFLSKDMPKTAKDNVRRLFLIYAFGEDGQIEYFENECRKEFGI